MDRCHLLNLKIKRMQPVQQHLMAAGIIKDRIQIDFCGFLRYSYG